MAGHRKFDETISTWLEDTAPTGLPQRVLAATFQRTRSSRQQLGWRGVLRRLQMPRFTPALGGATVVVMAAVLALNFMSVTGPGGTTTPSTSAGPTMPPSEAEVTELLNGFLKARIAGEGAQQYLAVAEEEIPLLYATTSGARYERAEFEPVRGIKWPRVWVAGPDRLAGLTAFKVRLFGGDTVVEQLLFFTPELRPLGLGYPPDGFGTHIAPTTEDGQPVARLFSTLDDEVTLEVAHPWVGWIHGEAPYGYQQTAIRLIPEGPGVRPTTDGAQRGDWDYLDLRADPAWVGTDCRARPSAADAEALAESIRSDTGLEATAPVAVRVGGTEALMMDVKIAAGAPLCIPVEPSGDLSDAGFLHQVWEQDGPIVVDSGVAHGRATGEWMRLYLFDVPERLSMRILAMAILAPESRFESTVEAAAPVIASIEFHAP
jgi:hypothetical protein